MRLLSVIGTMSRKRKDLRIIYQELIFEIATIILTNSGRENAPSPRILVSDFTSSLNLLDKDHILFIFIFSCLIPGTQ